MLILLYISGLSERLGGEEHLCSFLANTACKHKHRISHSLFLSCFVVHQFCLPAVQLGGQPRHWGVEPGFSPMPVQEIPPNTFLLCGLELPKACIPSSDPLVVLLFPRLILVRPIVCCSFGLFSPRCLGQSCSPVTSQTVAALLLTFFS